MLRSFAVALSHSAAKLLSENISAHRLRNLLVNERINSNPRLRQQFQIIFVSSRNHVALTSSNAQHVLASFQPPCAPGVLKHRDNVEPVGRRHAPGFAWSLLSAIVALIAGAMLLYKPVLGMVSLTYVLIAYFIVDGILTIILAIRHRDVQGYIAMLLDLPSLSTLKSLLAALIERTAGNAVNVPPP